MTLQVHSIIPESYSNGPGLRGVLWTQGCRFGCPGCFNPETHAPHLGSTMDVSAAAEKLLASPRIEGVTISGGEPLEQLPALLELLRLVKRSHARSVLLFTGFDRAEIQRLPGSQQRSLSELCDVMIVGRYQRSRRLARGLIGSTNKKFIFNTTRYAAEDLAEVPEAEVYLEPDGRVLLTGINPMRGEL